MKQQTNDTNRQMLPKTVQLYKNYYWHIQYNVLMRGNSVQDSPSSQPSNRTHF